MTDQKHEGVFSFVDGTFPEWSIWTDDNPNGKTNQNCAVLRLKTKGGQLNDKHCDQSRGFVCEVKLGALHALIERKYVFTVHFKEG